MKFTIPLISVAITLISCNQNTNSAHNTSDSLILHSIEKNKSQTQYQKFIDTKYEYIYPQDGTITILNSLPKGESYTDPNGNEYFKIIFWSRIINNTNKASELKFDFPANFYKLQSSPNKHFKILIHPNILTLNRAHLTNYGLTDLKSFLDDSINRSSSLRQIINPKESSGFYAIILFDTGISGPFRAGLSIKGEKLFYRVSTPENPFDTQEINCGQINLTNQTPEK